MATATCPTPRKMSGESKWIQPSRDSSYPDGGHRLNIEERLLIALVRIDGITNSG
jgi:hypothetical protein